MPQCSMSPRLAHSLLFSSDGESRANGDHAMLRVLSLFLIPLILFLLQATPALADVPKLDRGDTAWMLTSTALVLMMTVPGLALFYAGMVRKMNILNTMA